MADRNVTAAAQHFDAEEAAAESACAGAATAHGLTADQAEQCDDGDQGCPACPWRKATSGEAPACRTYTTQPAESLCGIAIRQLGDESRWTEIRDLNADRFPDMLGSDYYPVGTMLKLPPAEASTGA